MNKKSAYTYTRGENPTLTILEDYLEQFKGAVIVVSHDRYFLDKVADRLFVFEDGNISIQQTTYSDYLENKEKKEHGKQETVQRKKERPANRLTYMEKKELAELEKKMPVLEDQVKNLEDTLNTLSDYEEIKKVSDALEEKRNVLEESEMRWMELSEKMEG